MNNRKSLGMWLICKLLPLFTFKGTKDAKDAQKLLSSIKVDQPIPYNLLKTCKSHTSFKICHGIPVFIIGDEYEDNTMFIHGGAFVFQLDKSHVDFCDRLAMYHKIKVTIPVYPLLPKHTFCEVFDILESVYNDLPSGTPLIGDSAGGTLAAGLSFRVSPRQLILFSPWTDLSMSNLRLENDAMFSKEALRVYALAWAGGIDLRNPILSPFYGDLTTFPDTVIYSGTSEMLYDDAKAFYEKLRKSGVNANFKEGYGLPHDFVLFPTKERDIVINELSLKKCHVQL